MKLSLVVGIILVTISSEFASSQNDQITNPADFIIETTLKKAEENEALKRKLVYKRSYRVNDLNNSGQPKNTKKDETVLVGPDGKEQLLEPDGQVAKTGKPSAPKYDLLRIMSLMRKLDEFELERIEMINNRPYYVINFKPKPKQKVYTDEEEIIIRSEGTIYIDIEKFYIWHMTAHMTSSYRRFLVFNLNQAGLDIHQEEFEKTIVVKSLTIIARYSLFGVSTFEKRGFLFDDYQKTD